MNREHNYWQRRITASRVTRRRLLGGIGVAGVGAAGLALVGCGDDSGGTSTPAGGTQATGGTTPAAQVKRDGTYNIRQPNGPQAGINPTIALQLMWPEYAAPWADMLWRAPSDTLVTEGWLAATTETPDPLKITAKLKSASFHNKAPVNGRAVTSEDVVASFMMMKAATKATKDAWWTELLDKIEAPDAQTITITLKAPDAWTYGHGNGIVVPKEHATNPSLMDNDLIGSSLFEFVSHENGNNFKMKRNEAYREQGLPNLAGVQFKLIQEQSAALAALSAKQIDTLGSLSKEEKDSLVQQLGKDVSVNSDLDKRLWWVVIHSDGKWADPRIQQAFSLALDRKEMVTLLGSGEGQASGPVPPQFGPYAMSDADLAATYGKFDPAQARQMLSAAAFDTSKEYRMPFPALGDEHSSFAQVVQSQLQKNLGIKTKLVSEDLATWITKSLYVGNFDITPYPSLGYDTPNNYVAFFQSKQSGAPNYTGLNIKEMDDAYAKQAATYDEKARQQQFATIQKRMWELGNPFIPTFVKQVNSVTWNYVKNRAPKQGFYATTTGQMYIDKG